MKNNYQSEALQVIHEDMKGMHQLGIISDARMREFDEMCLIHEPEPVIADPEAGQIAEPQPTEVVLSQ